MRRITAAAEALVSKKKISKADAIIIADELFVKAGGKSNKRETYYAVRMAIDVMLATGILIFKDDVYSKTE